MLVLIKLIVVKSLKHKFISSSHLARPSQSHDLRLQGQMFEPIGLMVDFFIEIGSDKF